MPVRLWTACSPLLMRVGRCTDMRWPTEVGQRVRCVDASGYDLTKGKEYVIVAYYPPGKVGAHSFPDYVGVVDDSGKTVTSHTYRYEVL